MALVGIQDDQGMPWDERSGNPTAPPLPTAPPGPTRPPGDGIGNTGRGDPGPIVPAPGGPYTGALPPGVSREEFEDALRRNPGDEARLLASGWPSSGGGGGGSRGPSPSKQFSDPLSGFLEDWSNRYAQQLENPPQNSGRALFERALEQISGQFKQGGFTPAENEVFQTQALDPLERLRTARKQQVMEELSRRGIDPRSGVGMSMLQDVDRQFDANRAQTQRSIAGQGAQETQQRMLQAVQLLSTLAGSQDQRMGQAFNYYSVPYNLSNNAFNQSMQFSQMNNPLSLIQPLLALSGQQQGRQDSQGAALADLIWALTRGGG